jgi:hypothetical protein
MAGKFGEIEVEGLKEFQSAARRAVDSGLPKRLGEANKSIGQLVISRLSPSPDPSAVGTGAGAAVRASAAKREVLLRVGGAHRAGKSPQMQWGRQPGPMAFRSRPARPYIRETVESNRDEIEQAYLKAVSQAMKPAFNKTEP